MSIQPSSIENYCSRVILCIVFMIILSILLCSPVIAEDAQDSKHEIGIIIGASHNQVRDELLAPLRWDGFGPVLGLWYKFQKGASRHMLELNTPFSFPKNRYDHASWTWEFFIGYSYLHEVFRNTEIGSIQFGGMLDWSATGQEYYSWDASHVYWLNAYELGPSLGWQRSFNEKHVLAAKLAFPLAAIVSRPPTVRYNDEESDTYWLEHAHDNIRISSLHEYISLTARLDYDYQINSLFSIGCSYLLRFKTYSEPVRITSFSNSILLKLIFTISQAEEESK